MNRCPLDPDGKCIWREMECLYCSRRVLELAVQQLRWSLPLVGKYFKTHEHQVECGRRQYEIRRGR